MSPWLIESKKAQSIITQYNIIKEQYNDISEQQKELRKWIKANLNDLQGVAHYNNVDEEVFIAIQQILQIQNLEDILLTLSIQ